MEETTPKPEAAETPKNDELTLRQAEFLKYYLDPKSETWGNAKQSALRAGYSEEYAENITHLMPEWLSDAIGDSRLITTALNNLVFTLNDGDNRALQWDATKFTLKGLKKDKFSERSELTGKDGTPLKVVTVPPAVAQSFNLNDTTDGQTERVHTQQE